MGRGSPGTPLSSAGRISVEHVAAAVRKLGKLTLGQKTSLIDEIYIKQPNLLASCAVQAKFLTTRKAELLRKIAQERALSDALKAELKTAADEFKQTWK